MGPSRERRREFAPDDGAVVLVSRGLQFLGAAVVLDATSAGAALGNSASVGVGVTTPTRRPTIGGVAMAAATTGTIKGALAERADPSLGTLPGLFDLENGLRRFVNICVDEAGIRFLRGLDTLALQEPKAPVVPATGGGAG